MLLISKKIKTSEKIVVVTSKNRSDDKLVDYLSKINVILQRKSKQCCSASI